MDRFKARVAVIDAGGRYCASFNAPYVVQSEAHIEAIRSGFKRWQDRETARWPEVGTA